MHRITQLALLLSIFFHSDYLLAEGVVQPNAKHLPIEAIVKQIQSDEPLSQESTEHAQLLFNTVSHMDVSIITDHEIDLISSLLQDENDVVRFNAARALGYIGPKAMRAVPALEAALKKVQAELAGELWTGTSSEFEICPALKKITGRMPPKSECEFGDLTGD